ncbi:MAG: GNAT family N-acetyltransferase [Bacteroidota bacterium]
MNIQFLKIIIKKVEREEISKLSAIGKATFLETFGRDNSPSDMEKYLESHFSIKKITEENENPESRFFFALLNEEIVGYIKINTGKAQTEQSLKNALEIERIYVLTPFQGKKIGIALYNKALEITKSESLERIWLGVWEKNLKAIKFYQKNGFEQFDTHIFKLGDDEQVDWLMKLEIS